MKQFSRKQKEFILFLFIFVIVAGISAIAFWNPFLGAALALSTGIGIFLQGLRKIPADPPHIALVTLFGERIPKLKREGWRFFLFFDFVYGHILVPVSAIDFDLPLQKFYVPVKGKKKSDQGVAGLEAGISLTVLPAFEEQNGRDRPDLVINFLNMGGMGFVKGMKKISSEDETTRGVLGILFDIVQTRLREWGISRGEGPQDYLEAMGAHGEATTVLLKAILDKSLDVVQNEELFSHVYRMRFSGKKLPKALGNAWNALSVEEREKISSAVERRHEAMLSVRAGTGYFIKEDLGLVITRLNIKTILPSGDYIQAIDALQREKLEAQAEAYEADAFGKRVLEIADKLQIPIAEAIERFQVERKKITHSIEEKKYNIPPDTRKLVRGVARLFAPRNQSPQSQGPQLPTKGNQP